MKFFSSTAVAFALVAFVSSLPVHVKRAVDPALVPEFGVQPGDNPTGTGNCDGITNSQGQVVKIPCSCPPDRNSFIKSLSANVAAGHVITNPSVLVTFPTDDSKASRIVRIQAAVATLQNLRGPGVGCPAASTTFLVQQRVIAGEPDTPSSSAPAPPSPALSNTTPASTCGNQTPLVNATLVPDLGHQAGLNPDGHGNCDGITNAQGEVIKVPCACPPDRESFIQALSENVAAGRAVHNPSIIVSFPIDDSKDSLATRIEAAIITLQNLRGPGVGCPASSTALSAQLKAAQG